MASPQLNPKPTPSTTITTILGKNYTMGSVGRATVKAPSVMAIIVTVNVDEHHTPPNTNSSVPVALHVVLRNNF